jgi:hypothetical protein
MPDFSQVNSTSNRIKLIPITLEYTHDICHHFTSEITHYMWPSTPKTDEQILRHILEKRDEMKKGNSKPPSRSSSF